MAKSENIKKLEEIVKKIESSDYMMKSDEMYEYRDVMEKIDSVVHKELVKIEEQKDNSSKLQNYEVLFTTILGLLESIKHVV